MPGSHFSRRFVTALAAAVTLVVCLPFLLRTALINWVQISALHGWKSLAPLALMRDLAPSDPDALLRHSLALANNHHYRQAAIELEPVITRCLEHPLRLNQCIAILYRASSWNAVVALHRMLDATNQLSAASAAMLLDAYISQNGDVASSSVMIAWWSKVLDIPADSQQMEWIRQSVNAPSFWKSLTGRRLLETIRWRAKEGDYFKLVGHSSAASNLRATHRPAPGWWSEIQLGEELILNGGFEHRRSCSIFDQSSWCSMAFWEPSMMNSGNPWNVGLFVIGVDSAQSYSGWRSMRIDGIYVERRPEREPARAGYWHPPIDVQAGRPYLISFVYKTEPQAAHELDVSIWVSKDARVLFAGDYFLPPTGGLWRRVRILGWNRADQVMPLRPLLRKFGEGTVWFDDFSVREVLSYSSSIPLETVYEVSDVVP